jgi:F5/8 type C domain
MRRGIELSTSFFLKKFLSLSRAISIVCAMLPLYVSASQFVDAAEVSMPPRSQWRATSSAIVPEAMAPKFAIDGDASTKWGGPFSANHWLQVDLGRSAPVGGVLIRWDLGFATSYVIQTSNDDKVWTTAFETTDSPGGADYVFFPTVNARYVRVASVPRTADWGVSIFEFEPLAPGDRPVINGFAGKADTATLWSPGQGRMLDNAKGGANEVDIHLPRPLPVAGLEVFWSAPRAGVQLEARDSSGKWITLAADPGSLGATSDLAAPVVHTVSDLKLTVQAAQGQSPAIQRLRLLGPTRVMTAMKRYEITASRAHRELFPSSLHAQQVYWTAVGIPGGRQKSVFDEYGDVEAFKAAALIQPLWRDASGRTAAPYEQKLKHSLRAGWMPIPAVEWSPQPGLQLRSEALAIEQNGAPVTLVRHRLENVGKAAIDGTFSLIVRPMQMSPPWQNGGLSPIHSIAVEGTAGQTSVRVNSRVLVHSLTSVDARGASPFGAHGETEITGQVATGTMPPSTTAQDVDGLAAAALSYHVQIAPGAHRDIVIAFPLGAVRIDGDAKVLPASPPLDRAALMGEANDPGSAFDALSAKVAKEWEQRVGRIGLSLPDESLVNMLRAQAAYMLINQTGPAMQPGPRNYNRSFIRDGSATAAVLVRMGMAKTARDYARWYGDHAVHDNGLVSPILNDDGTVNKGFGSDLEHDSQGEFIWLIAEIARLDGGAATVREFQPQVKLALKYLQTLRERTLVPGYMADQQAPQRFRGVLAPSISHEGYSTPTHSYWDDYWGLKGWHDGAWLADQWGDRETAKWAHEQYEALRKSVSESIRATIAWKKIDFIPASADTGDSDPTSVSIGIDPCDQQGILPADALRNTFERYLQDVLKRHDANALYAYTPYEMRNVLTYVHLNRPREAEELLNQLMRDRKPMEWQVLAEVVQSQERRAIYLGDMPHTWIGAEYARSIFGMLMHEGDERLQLLPGTPVSWVRGPGLKVTELPTAYGRLSMSAQQSESELRVTLAPGLRADTKLQIWWPSRTKPKAVLVDGVAVSDYSADGIQPDKVFRELKAQW